MTSESQNLQVICHCWKLKYKGVVSLTRSIFNKLMSVFASVLLLIINCVITLSKWLWNHEPQASGSVVNFDNVMTKFIINKRTDT